MSFSSSSFFKKEGLNLSEIPSFQQKFDDAGRMLDEAQAAASTALDAAAQTQATVDNVKAAGDSAVSQITSERDAALANIQVAETNAVTSVNDASAAASAAASEAQAHRDEARSWASSTTTVGTDSDGVTPLYGARKYAQDAGAAKADAELAQAGAEQNAALAQTAAANAATSEANAATSAGDAGAAATAAAARADEAAAAASSAVAALDAFDDLYLGAKSAEPSTDNDGAGLTVGALYWDAAAERLRVWNGAAWLDIEATGVSSFARMLLDDPDASAARATLGTAALSGATFTGQVELSSVVPMLRFDETGAAADAKLWDNYAYDQIWRVRKLTDAGIGTDLLLLDRDGFFGIGVAPVNALHVEQSSSSAQIMMGRKGDASAGRMALGADVRGMHFYNSSYTEQMQLTPGGQLKVGTAAMGYTQTDAPLSVRRSSQSIEFGHANPAGYASAIGAQQGNGMAFISFTCTEGTNDNTYQTNGLAGSLIRGLNGALYFSRVTTATGDNLTPTDTMTLTGDGRVAVNVSPNADTQFLVDSSTLLYSVYGHNNRGSGAAVGVRGHQNHDGYGGYFSSASGSAVFADGGGFGVNTQVRNYNGIGGYFYAADGSYVGAVVRSIAARAATTAYHLFDGYSSGGADLEFYIKGDGSGAMDGALNQNGADYAEYFEWEDGNPTNEDRRGLSVVLTGNKIRPATATDEDLLGVVSSRPTIVGDASPMRWDGKYLKDDFGDYILEGYEVVSWIAQGELLRPAQYDADGIEIEPAQYATVQHSYAADSVPADLTVPADAARVVQQRRKLNPAFDPNAAYVPRADRPEWAAIGLMGKLRVRKGQPTASNWRKLRDISEGVEEWLIK